MYSIIDSPPFSLVQKTWQLQEYCPLTTGLEATQRQHKRLQGWMSNRSVIEKLLHLTMVQELFCTLHKLKVTLKHD